MPPIPDGEGVDPLAGVRPRQLPGMARLMELTPELYAHYADPAPVEQTMACPNCGQPVAWDTAHDPNAWRHETDSRWCSPEHTESGTVEYPNGATQRRH